MQLVDALARRFKLTTEERALLLAVPVALDRRQRKRYKRELEPKLPAMVDFLRQLLMEEELRKGPEAQREWATQAALSILGHGSATVLDAMLMEVVGRRPVSQIVEQLRK